MSWLRESWRLKLLAVGLSVLMLGAVAFSQNPPTFKTLTLSNFQYTIPPTLIVINPPTRTTIRVIGPADTIQSLTANSFTATFDLTKASAGPAVKVNLVVKPLDPLVNVQNQSVPFALNIDLRKSVSLQVQVRYPRVTEGWTVTKASASCPNTPCVVTFTGPASWEADSSGQPNLKAFADDNAPVQSGSTTVPNLPVSIEQGGTPIDPASFLKTVPNSSLDVTAVQVQIDARTSTTRKQVVLIDATPSHGAPTGYRVTNITIDPITVVISGPAQVLAKITTLTLPAVDLSGHTSNFTFRVTIPYPAGVTGSVLTARITYSIAANPNAQPSPSP